MAAAGVLEAEISVRVYDTATADRARLSYVMLKILACLEQCHTSFYG